MTGFGLGTTAVNLFLGQMILYFQVRQCFLHIGTLNLFILLGGI